MAWIALHAEEPVPKAVAWSGGGSGPEVQGDEGGDEGGDDCPRGRDCDDYDGGDNYVEEVPEFSTIALTLAVLGGLAGFFVLRKRK